MQHGRNTIRVEMRDHQGRVTAILDEIGPESEIDYQRLAKRTFLNFQSPQGSPHYSCHVRQLLAPRVVPGNLGRVELVDRCHGIHR